MSRTFRRSNYELVNMHRKGGRKIAGFYTERDFIMDIHNGCYTCLFQYRIPTKEELFIEFREAHCDGVFNRWGMPKEGRKLEEGAYRSKEKGKIVKFLQGKVEDVIPDKLMKRPPWYWY